MKKTLLSAVTLCTLGLVGCGEDAPVNNNPHPYDTQAEIMAHLESKTLTSKGTNLATHPLTLDEDVNYGDVKACFNETTIQVGGGKFTVNSKLGQLEGNPALYAKGECNRGVVTGNLGPYESTSVTLTNIKTDASCFDVDVVYPGFTHTGRGKLSADGKTLTLELFVKDKAVGIRCADGEVGAATVKIPLANGTQAAFSGNAQQVYTLP
jgi:hypothetical protein